MQKIDRKAKKRRLRFISASLVAGGLLMIGCVESAATSEASSGRPVMAAEQQALMPVPEQELGPITPVPVDPIEEYVGEVKTEEPELIDFDLSNLDVVGTAEDLDIPEEPSENTAAEPETQYEEESEETYDGEGADGDFEEDGLDPEGAEGADVGGDEYQGDGGDEASDYEEPSDSGSVAVLDEGGFAGSGEPDMEYLGDWTISFYCNCEICCGQWSGGATASGAMPSAWWTAATADLPFGTVIYVDGLGTFEIQDRGTEYGWLDVFVGSHDEALANGLQTRSVYIVR